MEELGPHAANNSALTPLSFLDRAATVYGDCTSVVYNNVTYTWSQTHSRCLRLASALTSILSIGRGDVVSVVAPNIPAMYEMHFGVPMTGAILNTLNTRLDARTLGVLLLHSGAKVVFVDHEYISLVRQAFSFIEGRRKYRSPLLVPILEEGERGGAGVNRKQLTYETLIAKGDRNFEWVRPSSEWAPMVLNYTSGTTSAPKGVVHCHRGMYLVSVDSLLDWSVPKQPLYLWTLPMFHANGWSFSWGMAAVGGVNICLRKFDAGVIFSAISRHHVTHMCGAPVILSMLANNSSAPPLSSPVHVLTAGAPPPASILLRAEALGFVVGHGYGLTETGGHVVSCAWKSEWNKYPATFRARLKARQGVRCLGMDKVDVVDEKTGRSVKRDGTTLGEVVLRGGSIMLGYLKDPGATKKAIKNGWFYTGDVAVMHSDGYMEIKDRSKDVIISGGENISSVEVESVLYAHPAVKEAAVVARADEFWGESPCAFLSVNEKVTAREILAYCKGKLPRYMVPKTVVFKTELPKTSTGKIQKFALRELAKAMGPVISYDNIAPISRM